MFLVRTGTNSKPSEKLPSATEVTASTSKVVTREESLNVRNEELSSPMQVSATLNDSQCMSVN